MLPIGKKFTPFYTLIVIMLAIYFQSNMELIYTWYNDSNYSHGFLIPFVSLYLVWQKKELLKKIPMTFNDAGFIVIIIGLAMYIVGTAAAEYFSVHLSLIIVFAGITLLCFGFPFIKSIAFPMFFLLFMIPLPYLIYYSISFPLQLITTEITGNLLQLIGFPILQSGNILYLQNNTLEVVEACSGLRSLLTLSALGALLAYTTQQSTHARIILFFLTIPIAMGANIIRLIVTATGSVLISPNFAKGFLHDISGLIIFISGFILLGISALILKMICK